MGRTFDKAKWIEEKQEKLDNAQAALEEGLAKLHTDEDWKAMLRTMAVAGRLSVARLSFANQVLVQSQRPGTTRVATYHRWKQAGRQVRKGEAAITILRPVFRPGPKDEPEAEEEPRRPIAFSPLSAFALEQTDGPELPTPSIPDFTGEEAFTQSVERLQAAALKLPGSPVAGIELRERRADDHPRAAGWYHRLTRQIVITTEADRAHQFATLAHEVAHAILHGAGDHHATSAREVEAESTAYVVCHALGLDTAGASFPYVATWAGSGKAALSTIAQSGQRIAKAATRILDALLPELADEGLATESA